MNERRATRRVKLVLPALCWSPVRPDFYAVTEDVAKDGIRFKSAVVPDVGETITCSIRHTGSLEGCVIRVARQRFAVRVLRAEAPLRFVAQNLLAIAEEQNTAPPAHRAAPRVVPDIQDVMVTTLNGVAIKGRLLNISASGAALALDVPLEVGTLIRIGHTPAKVARSFDNGIGAAFLSPIDADRVGPDLVL